MFCLLIGLSLVPFGCADAVKAWPTKEQAKKAINDSTYLISKHPHDASGYVWRAGSYDDLNMAQKAYEDYSQAIKLEPKSSSLYVSRGCELDKLNRWNEAMEDFDKAVKLSPNHCFPYEGRGLAYLRRKQFAEAISDFEKAKLLAPEQLKKSYSYLLARAKSKLDAASKKKTFIRKPISFLQNSSESHFSRGSESAC
jgi:tetratricopeptide (TPR) repeat protein